MKYHRNTGKPKVTWKIIDRAKLDQYFIGKKSLTKIAFLEGLTDNNVFGGHKGVAKKYGIIDETLYNHSSKLQKLGIIEKSINKKSIKQQDPDRPLIDLRKSIRVELMKLRENQLSEIKDFIRKLTNKEEKQ